MTKSISDDDLNLLTKEVQQVFPMCGNRQMMGQLLARGIIVPEHISNLWYGNLCSSNMDNCSGLIQNLGRPIMDYPFRSRATTIFSNLYIT